MGVHGLWQLLHSAGKPVALESLDGKVLAVDVSIWLNKAAKGMRDKFGNPVYNAHLILVFHRICKLLFYRIKPIFIFDGGVPELKKRTLAARREKRLVAEGKYNKASQKLMQNYLKGHALETVIGRKGPKPLKIPKLDDQDIFNLPPIAKSSQVESSSEDDNVDHEGEWMAGMKSEEVEKMFEEIGAVDFESSQFKDLPPEIQHELLMEMKESYRRRYNKNKSQDMPEEANSFSDFQLKNLFRRGKITKQIDEVRKTMKSNSSGQIPDLDEQHHFKKHSKNFEANRVASEDKQHYILMKSTGKRKEANTLFNTNIEAEKIGIDKGIKNNHNFHRLERDPATFNEAYIDSSINLTFISESSDDSNFDSENEASLDKAGSLIESDFSKKCMGMAKDANIETLQETSQEECQQKNFFEDRLDGKDISETGSDLRSELLTLEAETDIEMQEEPLNYQNKVVPEKILTADEMNYAECKSEETRVGEHAQENIQQRLKLDDSYPSNVSSDKERENVELADSINTCEKCKLRFSMDINHTCPAITETNIVDDSKINAVDELTLITEKEENKNERQVTENATTQEISKDDRFDLHQEEVPSAVPKNDSVDTTLPLNRVPEDHVTDTIEEFKRQLKGQSTETLSTIQESIYEEQKTLQRERKRQARIAASVGNEEYKDVQELLRLFGIPFVVSPMEAEAQCAVLDFTDQVDGSITDDSDIFLFGGRNVFKNVFNQDKYAELYSVETIHDILYLDREKMIALAFLTGSDYTEGITGVGAVTAMEVLQEFGGEEMEPLIRLRDWYNCIKADNNYATKAFQTKLKTKLSLLDLPRSFPNDKVWGAYMNPNVDWSDDQFEWGKPDLESIRNYAREKFGWRSSRTDEVLLPVIKQMNADKGQTELRSYFKTSSKVRARVESKRLKRVVNLLKSGIIGDSDEAKPNTFDLSQSSTTNQALSTENKKSSFNSSLPAASSVVKVYKRKLNPVNSKIAARVPTFRQFQKRVAKSRAASRGGSRGNRRRRFKPFSERVNSMPLSDQSSAPNLDMSSSSSSEADD